MKKFIISHGNTSAYAIATADTAPDKSELLHVYGEGDEPALLSHEESNAMIVRIADFICAEFVAANGNSPNRRLCGGCMAPVIHNVILELAARVEGDDTQSLLVMRHVLDMINTTGLRLTGLVNGDPLAGLMAALGGRARVIELD